MSEVLSQSEIDALLSALTTGEVSAEEIRESDQASKIRNYDFRRAMRFSKDHMRVIARIHEHIARLWTTHWSGQLRSVVQIQVESVDQVPYEEFVRSMPTLTLIQVMELNPLDGRILIEINPQIIFAVLDRFMGGSIRGPYRERELTDIEYALIRKLMSGFAGIFEEAWKNVIQLEPRLHNLESNPQFVQLTPPTDTVLVISLSARVGSASGLVNVCIPHITVEPLLGRLTTEYFMEPGKDSAEREGSDQRLHQHVHSMTVDVSVQLGQSELTLRDILDLHEGDVIPLAQSLSAPVQVQVSDVTTFAAALGKHHGRYAVQILNDWSEHEHHDRG